MSSESRRGRIPEYSQHILNAISEVRNFISGMSFAEFATDRKTISAVERQLLIISEACKRINDAEAGAVLPPQQTLAQRAPEIPWGDIRGLGNYLRHDYRRIDLRYLWNTVSGTDLRELETALRRIFPNLDA